MGYRGLDEFFQGISMLGRSLQQIRSQKEEEDLRRLKNYYGDNIEAFRQDALKDEKVGAQYRKYVGDPRRPLPEDPKMAQQRAQMENLMNVLGPEYNKAIAAVAAGAPWETAIKQLGPKTPEQVSPEKMADLKLRYMNQNVGPQEVLAEGFRALMGQPSAKYSALFQQSSPEVQKMIESGPYGDINKWTSGVPNVKSAKQFEAEESARKEAESLRRYEEGRKDYKSRTDVYNRRLNDSSARAWQNLTDSQKKLAMNGLKSEMDRQRGPINQVIQTALSDKKRAEDALNKIRINNESRMRKKDWMQQPVNAELARIVQGLEARINKANEILSGKDKELKKLESWYNGQIKEIDPDFRIYTVDDEEDPAAIFTQGS